MKENGDSLKDLWDNIKRNNVHIMGNQEGETRKGQNVFLTKYLLKICLTWGRKQTSRSRKPKNISNKRNPKRLTSRHIVTKLSKVKR